MQRFSAKVIKESHCNELMSENLKFVLVSVRKMNLMECLETTDTIFVFMFMNIRSFKKKPK